MEFEWDENKAESNKQKHGIDFNDAKEVFKDPNSKHTPDLRNEYGEDRYIIIGKMLKAIISVVYTIRNKIIRIISARLANKRERENYLNQDN